MDIPAKIRNVQLLESADPDYRAFVEAIRKSKLRLRDNIGQRSYADQMSIGIESAIRKWIAPVGGLGQRIISYEQLFNKTQYKRRFRELDFVFSKDNVLYIGEIKLSSSSKRLGRAYKQLSECIDILERSGIAARPVLIYINLSYIYTLTPTVGFDPDFNKIAFQGRKIRDREYDFLNLDAVGIFDYALNEEFLDDKELLPLAIKEVQVKHETRQARAQLRRDDIPAEEWPTHVKSIHEIPVVSELFSKKTKLIRTDMTAHIQDALGKSRANRCHVGAIEWFDNEKGYGVLRLPSHATVFLHIHSFGKRPTTRLERNQVIAFRLKEEHVEHKEPRAIGAIYMETPAHFKILMSLLGQRYTARIGEQQLCLLQQGTEQIFAGRSEQSFIDTVINYYNKDLEDGRFVQFCRYLESIAVPLVGVNDPDLVSQSLYCHFYSHLRPAVLFQAWKFQAFRYIAYTEGVDYEIPAEVIRQFSRYMDINDWRRVDGYSYANTMRG